MVINKTWKYLVPCVTYLDQEFIAAINSDKLVKTQVMAGDFVAIKCGIDYSNHLFIVLKNNVHLSAFLDFFREQKCYENDYPYDEFRKYKEHVIVIKFPDNVQEKADCFFKSMFSKMYTETEQSEFFLNSPLRRNMHHVVSKNVLYMKKFIDALNKEFDTDLSKEDFEDYNGELDTPLRKEMEFLNYHLYKN
jgi:hypothetical protein